MHAAHPDDSTATWDDSLTRGGRGTNAKARSQHEPNTSSVPKQPASTVASPAETTAGTPYCESGASSGDPTLDPSPSDCVTCDNPSGAASAIGASNATTATDNPSPAYTALVPDRTPRAPAIGPSSSSGRKRSTLATIKELITASPT